MKKRLIWVCLVILMIVMLLFTSCSSYRDFTIPSSLSLLVPGEADLVAKVEIQEILNDGDLNYLYQSFARENPGAPRTVNTALDLVRLETGIDPRNFTEAVIFASTSDIADLMTSSGYPGLPYYGAILKGTFNEKQLIRIIERMTHSKLETHRYKGAKIYTFMEKKEALFSFTFVKNELIVVGATRALEDAIDVMTGVKQPISGIVRDLHDTLGHALFKLASLVPSSLTGQIPPTADMDRSNVDLRHFRDVNMVGFPFAKMGSTVVIEVQLHCNYQASAQGIDDLVDNLILLFKEESPPSGIMHLLGKVDMAVYGSVFSLRISETTAEIEDLIRSLID